MKKRIPFLLFVLVLCSVNISRSQSWVEKMQDPTVNFYDVQKAFNKKNHKKEKEMSRERFEAFQKQQKLLKKNNGVVPALPKGEKASESEEEEGEIPGWEVYKRWEDHMGPRLYPSGDRSVMINAMNDYLENFYNNSSENNSGNRAMSGNGTNPTPLAANWAIIGPTTTIPTGGGAGRVNFVRFDPTNTNTIYVGSPDGGLWKSTTGGTGWTTSTDNLAVIGCSDLAINPLNNQVMYLATGDGDASDTYSIGVLKSINGGTTWSPSGLNWLVTLGRNVNRLMINPTNPNTIFAAASNGIWRSINAGANWTQVSTIANIKDIEYKPGDTTVVYACSTTRFYKSVNGGTTYTNITSGLPLNTAVNRLSIAVSAANPTYVYVLAAGTDDGFNGVYRSVDYGATFTTRSTTPNILGWSNTGSDTGGQGWYDLSLAVSPTNAELVIVGGVNIWKSINGGTNWTINAHWTGSGAPYVHADIHALEFLPASATTYFAGCDGGFFKTANTGTNWSDLSNGLQIGQPYRLGCSATNANLLVTGFQDNGTNRWSGTATWAYIKGGDGMEALVDWSNANVQYGELYYGEISRTTTGGNLTTTVVSSGGTGVNADGDWVTPYIINPLKANSLVVGKAQAYKSVNRGTNWTALGTVTGGTTNIIALAYAPSDSNYLYMAKTNKFYASTNAGTAFTDRTGTLPVTSAAITYIAVASNNPAHVWVTFSGYSAANKVWYSADAGVTWTNYTTGLPNLPANCIVYQNNSTNDALYVGTDVGVYYRDNTAGSWAAYNTGLPNVIVKELEIQYSSSKLRAATFGRGIWQSDLNTPGSSPPVADFSANRTNICIGDCINFTDLSTGTPTSWSWSFPGASTTSSTLQNPTNICYPTAGSYNVTLIATNANGSNTITKTAYIIVSGTASLPVAENFEGATFPPAGWFIQNADAPSIVWGTEGAKGLERRPALGNTGSTSGSAGIECFSYSTDTLQVDNLLSSPISLVGATAPQMTFKRSYRYYNSATNPNNYHDELRVYVSTNCGATYGPAVYYKKGVQLATNGTINTSFTPGVAADWDTDTISLTPYVGQNIVVKFEVTNRYGNNVYLDDININNTAAAVASVSISSNDADNIICAGSSVTFTATPTNGGTAPVYQWQVNGSNVGTNSPTYTTTTLTNGQTVTCIMTSNLSGVTGSPATSNIITMTVNAIPATPVVTTNSPVCTGATINLSTGTVAGAVYAWTGPSTFTSALQNPTRPAATTAMAGTYSVTVTVNGCTSNAGTSSVVVNTTPTAPTASSNTPVCVGSTINLTASTVAGAIYSWTGPSTFTSAVQNPTRPAATTAMAGTYSVTATVGGCVSLAGTTTVVVNTIPATPTAASNTPVCSGTSINLTTPAVTGATYSWTGPSTFTSAVQNPTRPSATTAMAGTYSVTVSVNGCTSLAGTTSVVVNASPATPVANINGSATPAAICAGGTITLTTSSVGGATYSWTGPNSYAATVRNPPAITNATTAMAGTYSVTVTVGGCTSAAGTATIVVNPLPSTPTAASNSPVCTGSTINFTTPTVAGAAYAWTGPSGFTSAVQNAARTGATTTMAGTYSVTITVNGCTSLAGTTTVVVSSAIVPAVSIVLTSGTNPTCAGQPLTFTATPTNGGTSPAYQWQVNGINAGTNSSTFTSSAITNGQVLTCILTSNSPCASPTTATSNSITMVINPVPSAPSAGSNSPVCLGSTINLTSPTVSGAIYSWTGPNSFVSTIQNPSTAPSTIAMAGTYSVTVTVNGCTSAAGTTSVVVNSPATPTISISIASGTNPMCAGQIITFLASTTNGGSSPGYQWQVNGANSGTNFATFSSGIIADGDVVTCTLTSNAACVSPSTVTSTAITMSVNPTVTPSISISTADSVICFGTPVTFTSTIVNGGSSPSFQWFVNGANAGTNSSSYSSSSFVDGDVVTCSLTSTASCATSSTANSNSISMTVNPIPSTPTITQNGSVLTSSAVSGNQWYLDGNPIVGETNQTYTYTVNGTYTVIETTNGCSSAESAPVVIINVGIGNADAAYALSVYPNPNDGNFELSFYSSEKSVYTIKIENAIGQLVYNEEIKDFTGKYSKKLSVVEFGKGVYTVSLINTKKETVKKIIVY
jgi:PKD repeat protein